MSMFSRRSLLGMGAGALAATAIAGAAPAYAKQGVTGWVRSTIAHMSLKQKVGQLMVQEVYGVDPHAPENQNLAKYGTARAVDVVADLHLGGVIYFAWTNSYTRGPEGVARLSNALQASALAASGNKKVRIPLLVATDQEQGIVTRFGPPATQFPGSMALGATRSSADARTAAAITGEELRAVGINANFAPDADVNVNAENPVIGVRSFGSDPALVSQMVVAQVRGYQEHGRVSAAAKHFPGHGDTATDSHYGLPLITHTRQEWERLDAPPFRAAIGADVDMIMTAHLLVPALDDSGDPATLSKPILTGILRDQMGYEGVVITDSLEMQGVRDKYGDAEVAVRALEAGVDLLLMSPAPLAARDAVLAAVRSGRLSEKAIDAKVERVLRMKFHRGIVERPTVSINAIAGIVGTPEHLAAAATVTDHSITLVRNAGILPMAVNGKAVLVTGWGQGTTQMVADAFTAEGAATSRIYTATSPTAAQISQVVAGAQAAALTVVLTNNITAGSAQLRLVQALVNSGRPVVVVAVRNPYDVAHFDAPAEIATYSYSPVVAPALVRVITGKVNPTGKLPVDVPEPGSDEVAIPFGFGLSY